MLEKLPVAKSTNHIGRFASHGVKLENHEIDTINFFLSRGENIEMIVASHTPKSSNADFLMRGVAWEAKSPVVKTNRSISCLFYKALKQSTHIIFDLRRLKYSDVATYNYLVKLASNSRQLKKILIIRKDGSLEEHHKNNS